MFPVLCQANDAALDSTLGLVLLWLPSVGISPGCSVAKP